MLKLRSIFLLILLSSSSMAELAQYTLGAGDLIRITVYNEADLSMEVRIGLSGVISYPLLGELPVAGLSPQKLEENLVQKLDNYLVSPSAIVTIVEYRPFYVTGEVSKPGSYAFHPGLTIDKAISIAGGFTERASKSKITVVRDAPEGGTKSQEVKGAKLSDVVNPGDVITVDQSFF